MRTQLLFFFPFEPSRRTNLVQHFSTRQFQTRKTRRDGANRLKHEKRDRKRNGTDLSNIEKPRDFADPLKSDAGLKHES